MEARKKIVRKEERTEISKKGRHEKRMEARTEVSKKGRKNGNQ